MPLTNSIEELLIKESKKNRSLLNARLELLPVCNLNCKMCYIRTTPEEVRKNGGLKSADEWISIAKELLKENSLYILLTGGEVFLYPDFQRLYETLYDMGFLITINTNATMIDEKVVAYLSERPPKMVSISLYGASNETYEKTCGAKGIFDKVVYGIDLLIKNSISVEIKTVMTPLNIEDLEACVDFAKTHNLFYEISTYAFPPNRKLGISDQIRLNPCESVECKMAENHLRFSDEENFKNAVDILNKYKNTPHIENNETYGFRCAAASYACWVTWQGKMTPCAMLEEPFTMPFEEGVHNAWERLKEICDKIHMCNECSNCDKRNICSTCAASNFTETGSFEKPSKFHCESTKKYLSILQNKVNEYEVKKP